MATARTEYSPGEAAAGVSHSFSIVTYQRGYLIQVSNMMQEASPLSPSNAGCQRQRSPRLAVCHQPTACWSDQVEGETDQSKQQHHVNGSFLRPLERNPKEMGARQTGELEGLVDQSETGGLSLGDTLNLGRLDFLVRLPAALASLLKP